MKKKSNDTGTIKKYRGEIIVGLVTSAIWFSLEWLIKSAPKTGKTILGTIQNLIYSCSAKISLNSLLLLILYFVLGVFIAAGISPLISGYLNKKSKTKIEEIEKGLENIKAETNADKKQQKIDDYLKSSASVIEAQEKRINKCEKLLMVIVILYVVFVVLTNAIPLTLRDAFEYIAPPINS